MGKWVRIQLFYDPKTDTCLRTDLQLELGREEMLDKLGKHGWENIELVTESQGKGTQWTYRLILRRLRDRSAESPEEMQQRVDWGKVELENQLKMMGFIK